MLKFTRTNMYYFVRGSETRVISVLNFEGGGVVVDIEEILKLPW